MDVALQAVAFREPGLADTLDAWAAQPVPDGINVSYEAWVTPAGEHDSTWQQAADHPVFEAVEAPRYKLRARNAAHTSAVERGMDAFITADADAPPLNEKALTALTAPLRANDADVVVSQPVCPPNPVGIYSAVGVRFKEALGGLHGQCHSMTAEAWEACGPFSDDVDHTELKSVWFEEEYGFGRRLNEWGRVLYSREAQVYNDLRRRECAWRHAARRPTGEYCGRLGGDETFNPFHPR